jgi:D-alanine-D-alanine ligase
MKKNVLLVYGGGGTEHEVSQVTAQFIASKINSDVYNLIQVEISKVFKWIHGDDNIQLNFDGNLELGDGSIVKVDALIPCLHGYPGETGDLQSYLEMINVSYLGPNAEASRICFNKILTKLWLENVGVPTTPFIALSELNADAIHNTKEFLKTHGNIFIKASNQGSSVGCYPLQDESKIAETLTKAFEYSDFVLVEKTIEGRELEVSAFEYQGKLHVTRPGEIICPNKFYSYEEKYADVSETQTSVLAENVTEEQTALIKKFSEISFKSIGLSHLSRIDFFLTNDGEIYLNEINTFPGMTPISMFPKMMENYGVKFEDFISEHLNQLVK